MGLFAKHTSREGPWGRRVLRTLVSRPQRIGGPGAKRRGTKMRAGHKRSQDGTGLQGRAGGSGSVSGEKGNRTGPPIESRGGRPMLGIVRALAERERPAESGIA